jgi:23S rRNA (adenine2503-C2)-methyltransferase
VPGLDFRRPERERAEAIAASLQRQGILTKLRNSAGQDIDAACGQLRARATNAPAAKRAQRCQAQPL